MKFFFLRFWCWEFRPCHFQISRNIKGKFPAEFKFCCVYTLSLIDRSSTSFCIGVYCSSENAISDVKYIYNQFQYWMPALPCSRLYELQPGHSRQIRDEIWQCTIKLSAWPHRWQKKIARLGRSGSRHAVVEKSSKIARKYKTVPYAVENCRRRAGHVFGRKFKTLLYTGSARRPRNYPIPFVMKDQSTMLTLLIEAREATNCKAVKDFEDKILSCWLSSWAGIIEESSCQHSKGKDSNSSAAGRHYSEDWAARGSQPNSWSSLQQVIVRRLEFAVQW